MKPDRDLIDGGPGGLVGDVDPQEIRYLALGGRGAWWPLQRRGVANPGARIDGPVTGIRGR